MNWAHLPLPLPLPFVNALHHPAQAPPVLLVRVGMLVEVGRAHALIGLEHVRPGYFIGHGIVQTHAVLQREEGQRAFTRGVRQQEPSLGGAIAEPSLDGAIAETTNPWHASAC